MTKSKSLPLLLTSGCDCGQHFCGERAAAGPLRLESWLPPDHDMADGARAGVVGRLDALMTPKRPHPNVMFRQPPAHVDDGCRCPR